MEPRPSHWLSGVTLREQGTQRPRRRGLEGLRHIVGSRLPHQPQGEERHASARHAVLTLADVPVPLVQADRRVPAHVV